MLRGLLLFLLNPDAARLESIGKRLGILGPSVRMLASSLAGCLSCVSAMPASLKALGCDCYRAVPLFSLRMSDGGFDGLAAVQCWGEDATGELVLSFEGRAIMTGELAAPHGFHNCGHCSRALGTSLSSIKTTGSSSGTIQNYWESSFRRGIALPRSFLSAKGSRSWLTLENKLPRRNLLDYVARVNGTTLASGVFSTTLGQGRKLVLQLGVVYDCFEHGAISRQCWRLRLKLPASRTGKWDEWSLQAIHPSARRP
jgi:hypothetical protein